MIALPTGVRVWLACGHTDRDWLKIGGHAAIAIGGDESLAGWNF
jgi:hypothetical protein